MRLGVRLLLGFFLMVGLAAYFVMRVFVADVKPGVRQAMEATLVDAANVLAVMAADDLAEGTIAAGEFVREWEEAARRTLHAKVWQFSKQQIAYRLSITDARGIVVYDSKSEHLGDDHSRWNDVYLTLRGKYGARSSPEDEGDDSARAKQADGRTVMHVAAPIYAPLAATGPAADGDGPRRIIGVLTISQANRTFEPYIEASRRDILRRGAWLIGLSTLIALAMTWWLMSGIGRLRRYAQAVSAGAPVPPPPPRRDELGDLGQALETMRRKLDGKAYVEGYVQSLTHELKGPLAAIRGAAELLQEPLPEAERQRFAQHIRTQEQRLTETIDKLLALSEVEQHGWLRKQEPVDVASLLAGVADDAAGQLAAGELTLTLKVTVADAATLRGDGYLLRQALANLVDNAIAFSPRGAAIELVARSGAGSNGGDADRSLVIEVSDQGPGIPDYAVARVFERFYSLPRPATGRKSSGLGLAFVREVARLHGGTIELGNGSGEGPEGSSGRGAVAVLRLPLA
jgi:two-component system, OmpR family, sensor histidine kinase CreC